MNLLSRYEKSEYEISQFKEKESDQVDTEEHEQVDTEIEHGTTPQESDTPKHQDETLQNETKIQIQKSITR